MVCMQRMWNAQGVASVRSPQCHWSIPGKIRVYVSWESTKFRNIQTAQGTQKCAYHMGYCVCSITEHEINRPITSSEQVLSIPWSHRTKFHCMNYYEFAFNVFPKCIYIRVQQQLLIKSCPIVANSFSNKQKVTVMGKHIHSYSTKEQN